MRDKNIDKISSQRGHQGTGTTPPPLAFPSIFLSDINSKIDGHPYVRPSANLLVSPKGCLLYLFHFLTEFIRILLQVYSHCPGNISRYLDCSNIQDTPIPIYFSVYATDVMVPTAIDLLTFVFVRCTPCPKKKCPCINPLSLKTSRTKTEIETPNHC